MDREASERIMERQRRERKYRLAVVVFCTFFCVLVAIGTVSSRQQFIEPLPDYGSKSTPYQLAERVQQFGSRSVGTSGHKQMQGFLGSAVSTLRMFPMLQPQVISEQGHVLTNFITSMKPQFIDNNITCHVVFTADYDSSNSPPPSSGTSVALLLSLMYKSEELFYQNRKSSCQVSFVFLDGSAQEAAGAAHLNRLLTDYVSIPPSLVVYLSQIGAEGQSVPRLENTDTLEEYTLLQNIQQNGYTHVNLFTGEEVSSVSVEGVSYSQFQELFPAKWLPLFGSQFGASNGPDDTVLRSLEGILSSWLTGKMFPFVVSFVTIRDGTCVENGYLSITDRVTCSMVAGKQFLPFSEQGSNSIAYGCTVVAGSMVLNTVRSTYSMATSATDLSPHTCAILPGVEESDLPSRTWNVTEEIISFGTRVGGSNSVGYNRTKDLIYSSFMKDSVKDSWKIFNQSWSEEKGDFTNYYAQSTFGDLKNGHVVLSAHYDSKYFDPPTVFVGAIDSAVSCAALIAWVEQMSIIEALDKGKWSANSPVFTIIFFDGEEAFVQWTGTDNTYGSRHLARVWDREGTLPGLLPGSTLSSVTLFVLFDLIGCANQPINGLQPITKSQFATLGRLDAFVSPTPTLYTGKTKVSFDRISDDHLPFVSARHDLPLMHLIPDQLVYPWHTPDDDLEHLDKDVIRKFAVATWRFILMIVTQPTFV